MSDQRTISRVVARAGQIRGHSSVYECTLNLDDILPRAEAGQISGRRCAKQPAVSIEETDPGTAFASDPGEARDQATKTPGLVCATGLVSVTFASLQSEQADLD
jgi:hypothetical protein